MVHPSAIQPSNQWFLCIAPIKQTPRDWFAAQTNSNRKKEKVQKNERPERLCYAPPNPFSKQNKTPKYDFQFQTNQETHFIPSLAPSYPH